MKTNNLWRIILINIGFRNYDNFQVGQYLLSARVGGTFRVMLQSGIWYISQWIESQWMVAGSKEKALVSLFHVTVGMCVRIVGKSDTWLNGCIER